MIYLKYGSATAVAFNELSWDSYSEYEANKGISERGYLYEKIKWSRRIYRIIISADAITNESAIDFLENFWNGIDRAISFNGTNYVSVVPASGGQFPKSLLENARAFPEVAFELKSIAPVRTRATGEAHF